MIAWLVSLLSGSRRGRGEWRRFLVALLLLATVDRDRDHHAAL